MARKPSWAGMMPDGEGDTGVVMVYDVIMWQVINASGEM